MAEKNSPPVYSREKLLTFRRYAKRRDLLSVLLKEGDCCTIAQADALLEAFLTPKKPEPEKGAK